MKKQTAFIACLISSLLVLAAEAKPKLYQDWTVGIVKSITNRGDSLTWHKEQIYISSVVGRESLSVSVDVPATCGIKVGDVVMFRLRGRGFWDSSDALFMADIFTPDKRDCGGEYKEKLLGSKKKVRVGLTGPVFSPIHRYQASEYDLIEQLGAQRIWRKRVEAAASSGQ